MTAAAEMLPAAPTQTRRRSDLRRRLRQPSSVVALAWLLILVLASVAPGLLAPTDPLAQDLSRSLSGPSGDHWLGTDRLGRDLLARLIYGTGPVLLAAVAAIAVALAIGIPLGLMAGYSRGRLDGIISRIADGLFSLPAIIVVLAAAALLGSNLTLAMAVFGVMVSAGFTRLVRASTKAISGELFIDAARVQGSSSTRLAVRHILPNIMTPVIVQATLGLGLAVLAGAGLSFLGLGPPPPTPTWGGMITDSTQVLSVSPWQLVPPGLVTVLTALSFNFLGDALTDRPVMRTPSRRSSRPRRDPDGSGEVLGAGSRFPAEQVPAESPLLAVRGITVEATSPSGDHVTLLRDISFEVNAGESVALVGESGCGKTVMSRAILGMLASGASVRSGSILLDGREVAYLSEAKWTAIRGSQVAYIAQEPLAALDPCFSVGSLLVEVLRRHKKIARAQARQDAATMLTRVGIPQAEAMLKKYPHQLSGGTAQRVAIALALSGSPKLLIADEPTTALDVTVQAEILELLRSLQAETGMAVVLVTHDFGVVADFCSKVVVMYAGQVIEQAQAAELFGSPSHPYTELLLLATPHDAQRGTELPSIPGVVPPPGQWPTGCHFASRCPRTAEICMNGPIPLISPTPGHTSRCLFAEEEHEKERI